MLKREYAEYATNKACELIAIDSPSGYTEAASNWVRDAFAELGFDARLTTKGGVLTDLGGSDANDALLLEAHADTLGAMVAEIKGSGRLRVVPLGGMRAENAETENVRVRFNKKVHKAFLHTGSQHIYIPRNQFHIFTFP